MKTISKCLGFALIAGVATPAVAQESDRTGFYLGFDIGSASVNDADITYYDAGGTFGGAGTSDTASGEIDTKSAVSFGGTLGYDFGTIRSDIEIDYSRNRIRALTVNSVNGTAVSLTPADRQDICDYLEADTCGGSGNTFEFDGSRVRQLSAMGNVWLDLPIGSTIVPYAGGGIGVAGFEVDGEGKAKFAWQLGAGVAAHLSDTVTLTLDFRHRQVSRTTIEYDESSGLELGKLKTNAITAGARFTF